MTSPIPSTCFLLGRLCTESCHSCTTFTVVLHIEIQGVRLDLIVTLGERWRGQSLTSRKMVARLLSRVLEDLANCFISSTMFSAVVSARQRWRRWKQWPLYHKLLPQVLLHTFLRLRGGQIHQCRDCRKNGLLVGTMNKWSSNGSSSNRSFSGPAWPIYRFAPILCLPLALDNPAYIQGACICSARWLLSSW